MKEDCKECEITNLIKRSVMIPVYCICAFLFFVGALFINLLQLLNYVLFEFTFPWLRKNINFYLQDIILNRKNFSNFLVFKFFVLKL